MTMAIKPSRASTRKPTAKSKQIDPHHRGMRFFQGGPIRTMADDACTVLGGCEDNPEAKQLVETLQSLADGIVSKRYPKTEALTRSKTIKAKTFQIVYDALKLKQLARRLLRLIQFAEAKEGQGYTVEPSSRELKQAYRLTLSQLEALDGPGHTVNQLREDNA
jgi:hypothetical protein